MSVSRKRMQNLFKKQLCLYYVVNPLISSDNKRSHILSMYELSSQSHIRLLDLVHMNCFLKRLFLLYTLLFIVLSQYIFRFFMKLRLLHWNRQKRTHHSFWPLPDDYFTWLKLPNHSSRLFVSSTDTSGPKSTDNGSWKLQ